MSSRFRRFAFGATLWVVGLTGSVGGEENEAWFFRVASDQPTQILAIVRPPTRPSFAILTWSNSVPFAPAQVEIRFGVNGAWHTNSVNTTILQSDGHIVTAQALLGYVPGEIIVGFVEATTHALATELVEAYGLSVLQFGPPALGVAALVKVPTDAEREWCSRMTTNSIVKYAQPNYVGSVAGSE